MCGIAGYVGPNAANDRSALAALGALVHRGPDDEGLFRCEDAWLGHRRLSVIDLAGGDQPLHNEDETAWIVCNGEIYNHRALRAELEAKGHRFATGSDSEVVLHLYEEMGTRCLERLRGMFAFAIWDGRKKRLFAARDRLGQKPLYYHAGAGGLSFASEIKAVLAMHPGLARLNLEALDQYFSLRLIAPPLSMFEGIAKLPPAHFLVFDRHAGLRIARYWDLAYEPKLHGSEAELIERTEEALIESVKLHMVSDVEVGAFLSGGLDSTLVLAMAMTHAADRSMPTYTIGIPYGAYDEAPAARMVAERYGTRHRERSMIPSLTASLPRLVYHLDEPSDPLSVCSYLISAMASEEVKVVLGGDGGDELFGGYDRYYGNLYAGYYAKLPAALRRAVIGPLIDCLPDGDWYKSKTHQLKWLHRASFLGGGARYARALGYFYFRPELQEDVYGPELLAAARGFDAFAPIREAYDRAPAEHPVDRMLYADNRIRLPDHSVMILDRTSMAHGLEARSPLMDHKVAELAARLPVRLKVRGRQLRYVQRRICEKYIPRAVLERGKQGFASTLPYLLREEYRTLFRCFLARSRLAEDGVLRQSGIDRLRGAHEAGGADHANRLWLLLNAEAWYRMHVDGQSMDDMAAMIGEAAAPARPAAPRPVAEAVPA